MHSAERRSLTNNEAQVNFFRDRRPCFQWDTIACIFQEPESPVRGWANPPGKDKSDDQINESRDDQLQNSHSFLTIGEEKRVCQLIIDHRHKKRLSEASERIRISTVRGTGGRGSDADIPTSVSKFWRQWKVQDAMSRPRK
jgi:hypothetical protein